MSASSSPATQEFILEFLVNWRWVLHYLLHHADPANEAQYPQLFLDARAMLSVLSGSFSTITTVGAMPFGALDMARCGFYHLLLAEILLGCTPHTLRLFLLTATAETGDSASSKNNNATTPRGSKELFNDFTQNEGLNSSVRSSIDPRRVDSIVEDTTFQTARKREETYTQAIAVLLRWITRSQHPDSSPILHLEELFISLNMPLNNSKQSASHLPFHVNSSNSTRERSSDRRSKLSMLLSRVKEASKKLSQLVPFYLGAHTFLIRSLLLYYTRTVLSIDSILTHTRHLLCRTIPQVCTVEKALMVWMRAVVKLLADAPGSSKEQPLPHYGTLKHSKDASNVNTSFASNVAMNSFASSSFSFPRGLHRRDWVIWRQTFLHLQQSFYEFLHSGIVLSVVLYFYHPDLMPLEKVEIVELSGVRRGEGLSKKSRTWLPENSGEGESRDEERKKGGSFSRVDKGACCVCEIGGVEHTQGVLRNWGNILKALKKLGIEPGLSADEVVYHGRGALQLHVLRVIEELFAELATHAEEEVRASVEWELTQDLICVKEEEDAHRAGFEKEEEIPALGERRLVPNQEQKERPPGRGVPGGSSSPSSLNVMFEPIKEAVEDYAMQGENIEPAQATLPPSLTPSSVPPSLRNPSASPAVLPSTPQHLLNFTFCGSDKEERVSPFTPPSSVALVGSSDLGSTVDDEDRDFQPHILMEPYKQAQESSVTASPLTVSMKMLKESQSMGSTQGAHSPLAWSAKSRDELNLPQVLLPPPQLSKLVIPPHTSERLPSDNMISEEAKAHNSNDSVKDSSREGVVISPKTSLPAHRGHLKSIIASTVKESPTQNRDRNIHEISRASNVTKSKEHSIVILSRKSKNSSLDEFHSEFRDAEESKLIELLEGQMKSSVELPSRRLHDRSPPRSECVYVEHSTVKSSSSSRKLYDTSKEESVACFTVSSSDKQPLYRNTPQAEGNISRENISNVEVMHLDPRNSTEWDLQRVQGAPISTGNSPEMNLSPLSIDKCSSDVNYRDQAPVSSSSKSEKRIAGAANSISHHHARRNNASVLMPPSPDSTGVKAAAYEKKTGKNAYKPLL